MKLTNVTIISAAALMRIFGMASTWVYTSIYMYEVLGMSLYIVGVVYTISGIIAALSQVYGGRLGDLVGYRRMILTAFSIGTMAYLAMFFVTSAGKHPWTLSLLFFFAQTTSALQRPSSNALLALSSNKPLRSFSILRIGANLGWGIGPATGGFVIQYLGYPVIYLMAAVMSGITTLFVTMLVDLKPSKVERRTAKISALPFNFIILGVCGLLIFMVQAQESVTLANYASSFRHLPTSDLGFIYMANGIAVLIFQGIVYRISSRISTTSSFVFGSLIYSMGYFTMSLDTVLPTFIVSMTVLSIGEDFAFPMGNVIVSKLYGEKNIGFYMGIYNAFLSVGRSLGPALGGFALAFLALPSQIWLVVTLPGFLSAFIFYFRFSNRLRKTESVGG